MKFNPHLETQSALLGRIQHPNVVQFQEAGLTADAKVNFDSQF